MKNIKDNASDTTRLDYSLFPENDATIANECYEATCASGWLKDWETPEEDKAWTHLQRETQHEPKK